MDISTNLSKITGSATAQIFSIAKEMESKGKDIIHLEIGQPNYGPLTKIIEATKTALTKNETGYTVSKGIEELRESIAKYHEKNDSLKCNYINEIVITSGAKLAIFGAVWSVTNSGDNVIILNPSWVSYKDIVLSLGAEARFLKADMDFNYDINELDNLIDNNTKAMIVNSPCNPTGAMISEENMKSLAEICRKNDILLISDEIYHEYIYDKNKHYSLFNIENWKEIGVVVNGFSKTFSMTGFRLGYVIGDEKIIKEINKVMQLTASCGTNFAQHGAIEALNIIDEMREFIKNDVVSLRNNVIKLLDNYDIQYLTPKGGIYVWLKIPSNDSTSWAQRLLENKGVALTPGRAFGPDGEGFVRICFTKDYNQLEEGIKRIGQFLAES